MYNFLISVALIVCKLHVYHRSSSSVRPGIGRTSRERARILINRRPAAPRNRPHLDRTILLSIPRPAWRKLPQKADSCPRATDYHAGRGSPRGLIFSLLATPAF